jgi:hypothetical protein
MSNFAVLAGPIRFVNKMDTRDQRTQSITESTSVDGAKTYALHIRYYKEAREEKRGTNIMEDLETALIRFQTNCHLFEAEGYEN